MFFLIGSWSLSLYNFLLAFVICGGVIIIGEVVSTLTKVWVPSVFVSVVLLLLGYWTILPHDLVKDSFLIPFGATLCIYLLITHLGTIISLKQLMQQWRTVTVCLAAYFIAPFFMDRALVITGLPPLTGGIVAATMMQTRALRLPRFLRFLCTACRVLLGIRLRPTALKKRA